MSTVSNIQTGWTNAFEVVEADGCLTIEFADPEHRATAKRVKDPGSFGAALARQALAQGLDAMRSQSPGAKLSDDVRRYCTHSFDVSVRLGGASIGNE